MQDEITLQEMLAEIGRLHMVVTRQAARLAYYEQQERDRKPAEDAQVPNEESPPC